MKWCTRPRSEYSKRFALIPVDCTDQDGNDVWVWWEWYWFRDDYLSVWRSTYNPEAAPKPTTEGK